MSVPVSAFSPQPEIKMLSQTLNETNLCDCASLHLVDGLKAGPHPVSKAQLGWGSSVSRDHSATAWSIP